MKPEPRWSPGESGGVPKAHLLLPDSVHVGLVKSWCDASVNASQVAPYMTRCKSCLARVTKYLEESVVPPPDRVTTTLTIAVEHNRDQLPDEVLDTALRRLVHQNHWEATGEVVSSQPKGSN